MPITAETIDKLLEEKDPLHYRELLDSPALQEQWENSMAEFLSLNPDLTLEQAMYYVMISSKLGLINALKAIAKERGLL